MSFCCLNHSYYTELLRERNKMKSKVLLFLSSILIALILFLTSLVAVDQIRGSNSTIAQASINEYTDNFKLSSWVVVNSSLSDLLNAGWKIIAQSSHRVATVTTNGVGAIDQATYIYTISKGNKYITCYIMNPVPNKGGYSACRSIN
jgi:hypothetical protein